MGHRIDPCGTGGAPPPDATIVLVGCGGTGAFLAEAVCRLLLDRPGSLHLVDMDRVEPHNIGRQSIVLYGIWGERRACFPRWTIMPCATMDAAGSTGRPGRSDDDEGGI